MGPGLIDWKKRPETRVARGYQCKGNSSVVGDTKGQKVRDPNFMISRVKSLRRLVEELELNGSESGESDGLLLEGKILAAPILLSLATEIALKAWQCRERNGSPDQSHDLLKLFDGLREDAQRQLEEKMPEVPSRLPGLPPTYPGIRSALSLNKDVFSGMEVLARTLPVGCPNRCAHDSAHSNYRGVRRVGLTLCV